VERFLSQGRQMAGERTLIPYEPVEGQAMKKWQMPIITLLVVAAFVILYFNGLLGNIAVP
jgi:hypothetical protein